MASDMRRATVQNPPGIQLRIARKQDFREIVATYMNL